MGAPAARVGDLTAHGTPLGPGPGGSTVLIAGRAAWRVGVDVHVCPLADAARPHGQGTVAVGSATVIVGGAPAARRGDAVIEAGGGANAIASGEATVLIG